MFELTAEHDDASRRALNLLQYLRNDTALSDATVAVHDVNFAVHKCVVVSYSEFFRAAFSGAFAESKNNRLTLRDTSIRAVSTTIDYMYGTMSLENHAVQDWDHAFEVIELAHRLQIERLRVMMTRLLLDKFLTPSTMLSTFYHIKLFGTPDELETVIVYIAKHFRDLLDISNTTDNKINNCDSDSKDDQREGKDNDNDNEQDLEKLDIGQLEAILRCRDLVAYEHDKFRAIVRWCSSSVIDGCETLKEGSTIVRAKYAEELIWKHVELQRYDAEHLHDFLADPLVPRSVLCSMVGNLLPSGGGINGLTGCNLMDESRADSYGSGAVEYMFSVDKRHISLHGEARKAAVAFNFEHWACRVQLEHKDGAGLFMNLVFDHGIGDTYVDCRKFAFILQARVFADGYSKRKIRKCIAEPTRNSRTVRFELLMPAELPGYFKSMDLKEFKRIHILLGLQYEGRCPVDEAPLKRIQQHVDFFEFAPQPIFHQQGL